jgi:hypothetical protein
MWAFARQMQAKSSTTAQGIKMIAL